VPRVGVFAMESMPAEVAEGGGTPHNRATPTQCKSKSQLFLGVAFLQNVEKELGGVRNPLQGFLRGPCGRWCKDGGVVLWKSARALLRARKNPPRQLCASTDAASSDGRARVVAVLRAQPPAQMHRRASRNVGLGRGRKNNVIEVEILDHF
jgi:hypothetical protein